MNVQQWLIERQTVYSLFGLFLNGDVHKALKFVQELSLLQQFIHFFDGALLVTGAKIVAKEIDLHKYDLAYSQLILEDYKRLFIGPSPILAPPRESVYRLKDKLLVGDTEAAVRRYYYFSGLQVADDEQADHLALELAFMARLCRLQKTADISANYQQLNKQREFLRVHLLQWTPFWTADVIHNAKTEFWRGLALIIQGWLENDLREIQKKLKCGRANVDSKMFRECSLVH